ncbi:MAG: prepilin-type N-terminal cleavage/methylation domain-containing protein [bacterium]|nr:prepilin-type N-terminal cleavage/methylation domain-containing protein [bacterium]
MMKGTKTGKRIGTRDGFTLLEIVIVISLTAMLMVTVFEALEKVRNNEERVQRTKDDEKEAYLLYHRLSDLFRNASSFKVFNGREQTGYFRGYRNGVVFLSRAPLVSPYRGVHFVELQFDKGRLLYREKMFRQPELRKPTTFEELKDEPFYTLLEEVDRAVFQFYGWDQGAKEFLWRKAVNSFEKDQPPGELLLWMNYKGKVYNFTFPRVIIDEEKEVPVDLFR